MHFCTAAGIQCAAGGLEMGLRSISGLPPVFSVPPVALTMVFSLPLLRAGVGVECGLFSTTVFHQLH